MPSKPNPNALTGTAFIYATSQGPYTQSRVTMRLAKRGGQGLQRRIAKQLAGVGKQAILSHKLPRQRQFYHGLRRFFNLSDETV